jgi:hypothetical protein
MPRDSAKAFLFEQRNIRAVGVPNEPDGGTRARQRLPTDYLRFRERWGFCEYGRYWNFRPLFTISAWLQELESCATGHNGVGGVQLVETSSEFFNKSPEDTWWEWLESMDLLVFATFIDGRQFLAFHRAVSRNPEEWPIVLVHSDEDVPVAVSVGWTMADALIRWSEIVWSVGGEHVHVSREDAYLVEYCGI